MSRTWAVYRRFLLMNIVSLGSVVTLWTYSTKWYWCHCLYYILGLTTNDSISHCLLKQIWAYWCFITSSQVTHCISWRLVTCRVCKHYHLSRHTILYSLIWKYKICGKIGPRYFSNDYPEKGNNSQMHLPRVPHNSLASSLIVPHKVVLTFASLSISITTLESLLQQLLIKSDNSFISAFSTFLGNSWRFDSVYCNHNTADSSFFFFFCLYSFFFYFTI